MTSIESEGASGRGSGGGWEMTTLELTMFMVSSGRDALRSLNRSRVRCARLDCSIVDQDLAAPVKHLVGRRWLKLGDDRIFATEAWRAAVARALVNGFARLREQSARLLDVALMMTVLRLSKGELEDAVRDD